MKYSFYKYINHFLYTINDVFFTTIINSILYYFNMLFIPNYYNNSTSYDIVNQEITFIPRNLFLCYKNKNIPSNIIDNIKKLNPTWNIYFYDDNECSEFLHNFDTVMGELFDSIKDGPIKADIFRICILAKYGGVYSDIDNIILVPLDSIISNDVTFGVGASYMKDQLNPAFIISTKKNKILLNCITLYKDIISKTKYSYWGYSIVYCMSFILKSHIKIENKTQIYNLPNSNQIIQLFKEDKDYSIDELCSCMFNPSNNILKYYYLYYNNNKIITLHNSIYDSDKHKFN
jgi:hypothetical protein